MKKFMKFITCLGLVVTMVGCGGSKVSDEALDQLETSISKFTEFKSFDYSMDITEETSDANFKVYGSMTTKEALELSLLMDASANGEVLEKMIELYLTNNTLYMNAMGTKQKQELDLSAIPGLSLDMDTMGFDKEEIKKNLKEASLKDNTLTIVIDTKKLASVLESSPETKETSINDISMDIALENDFMKTITFNITGKQGTMDVKAKVVFSFDNINTVESISLPDDLDSYPLADDTSSLLD